MISDCPFGHDEVDICDDCEGCRECGTCYCGEDEDYEEESKDDRQLTIQDQYGTVDIK